MRRRRRRRRTNIFTSSHGQVNVVRPLKAALDIIVYFRSALTQVGPLFRMVEKAFVVGLFSTPDDARRSTRRVQTSMRLVACMSAPELAVDRRAQF
jgi:hypothetical protein